MRHQLLCYWFRFPTSPAASRGASEVPVSIYEQIARRTRENMQLLNIRHNILAEREHAQTILRAPSIHPYTAEWRDSGGDADDDDDDDILPPLSRRKT